MLLGVFSVAGAAALWLQWVDARYALRDDRPRRVDVTTADGWTLALWHRPSPRRRFDVPVILCHGLANNAAFMEFRGARNLGRALAEAGFDTWAVDLRGHGASTPPHEGPWDVTFDDHVTFDAPAVVEAVLRASGARQAAWIGHSLGGLVGLAAAPALGARLAALVTVGTPVFFRVPRVLAPLARLVSWLALWGRLDSALLRVIAPFAGRAPPPKLTALSANLRNITREDQRALVANVFAPVWRGVLRQLADWVEHDAFTSVDGATDYRARLATLEVPTLMVGGTVDQLAPPDVVRDAFALLTMPTRELQLFGRTYGHAAEYGHGDLLVGRAAPEEVYPVISRFLARAINAPRG
jgi:pimeloyl-ACP methyl ester carboxylesterase